MVFPNGYYMQYVEDQLRNAGIVIPIVNNDASPKGDNAPGTGVGAVDIYVSGTLVRTAVVYILGSNRLTGTVSVFHSHPRFLIIIFISV